MIIINENLLLSFSPLGLSAEASAQAEKRERGLIQYREKGKGVLL
jgi:hypothetical protein